MTKRNIYINAPLTRRVLSYFIDWYLGALCAAFPIAVVSQKLYGTMLKQNLLKIQQPYGFIAGIIGVIFALFYYIYIPFFVYKGQTVGKRICKVKIIQKNNQEKVVVEIQPLDNFYEAEEYHQKYLEKNPQGYCHIGKCFFGREEEVND